MASTASSASAAAARPSSSIDLAAGAYRARISRVGGALVELRQGDHPLVYCAPGEPPMPRFRGAVLVPWPNRIADGRYTFGGITHQLAINETDRMTALHGLALYDLWQVIDQDQASVTLQTTINPQPGYPFTLDIDVTYDLNAHDGLTIGVCATNVGHDVAPYGTSIHPYLRAGTDIVDGWTFSVDASHVVEVDPLRLLPVASVPVTETPFDFRRAERIGTRQIDHALTGFTFDSTGRAAATLVGPDGRGVRMSWDERCRWLQVHTTDLPGQRDHRRALAVEPMTCPPDAFNSGVGLVHLAPGSAHHVSWRICAVVASDAATA